MIAAILLLILSVLLFWRAIYLFKKQYADKKSEKQSATASQFTSAASAPAVPVPVVSASAATVSTTLSKTYKVAGITHYMDNIMKLAMEPCEYTCNQRELIDDGLTDERIWKYEWTPIKTELIPEPDNPEDSKAIKVVVDGEHVGYIKSGSCTHVRKLMEKDLIKSIECEIGGGPYKYIEECEDENSEKTRYIMDRGEAPFWVHLTIQERSH